MLYFCSTVSIVDFEQVNVSWVLLNPSQVLKKGCEMQPFETLILLQISCYAGFFGINLQLSE